MDAAIASDQVAFAVNIPDDYLNRIGAIAVASAHLEMQVDLASVLVARFPRVDDAAFGIFAHMTVPMRLNLLRAACDLLLEKFPRLKGYEEVIKQVQDAQTARNKVVHGKWNFKDGKATVSSLSARGKIKVEVVEMTLEELDGIKRSILEANAALWKLIVEPYHKGQPA